MGDGGPAHEAALNRPWGLVTGPDGSVYIADTFHNLIRRVRPDGTIETIAGTGSAEAQFVDDVAPARESTVRFPRGLGLAPDGSLFIADSNHYMVRRLDQDGTIDRVAGTGPGVNSGDGGRALEANFAAPVDVAIDADGAVYVASGTKVRRIGTDGVIETVAGVDTEGCTGNGGPATEAEIGHPHSIAVDGYGALILGGPGACGLHRVDLSTGIITQLSGLTSFGPVATDEDGNIYTAGPGYVQRLSRETGQASTLTMSPEILNPVKLSVGPDGSVYVADEQANRVWRVAADGSVTSFAGGGEAFHDGPADEAVIFDSHGLAVDGFGNVYFSDFQNHQIRRLAAYGVVSTVAGTGRSSHDGDGGHPLLASFSNPMSLLFDSHGNLLFIDGTGGVGVVRLITPGADGIVDGSDDERIYTIAGSAPNVPFPRDLADRGTADGGPATLAVFSAIRGMDFDSKGNLYVSDWLDYRVRKIVPGEDGVLNGGPDETITTVAGNGVDAVAGDGGPALQASISEPHRIAIDMQDNLYIAMANRGGLNIRRVDAETGIVTTTWALRFLAHFAFDQHDRLLYSNLSQLIQVDAETGEQTVVAGTGDSGYSGDGGDALLADFRGFGHFAIGHDAIYFVDNGNFRIRVLILAEP